ncbi:hypothetical protein [Neptuniibacter sp. QD37_11]|uniref:hypothetical protein n=1 Tax=Neptuniibacter sp. QD37_11 TaxID=3398209 RepID=UPI0039F4E8D3
MKKALLGLVIIGSTFSVHANIKGSETTPEVAERIYAVHWVDVVNGDKGHTSAVPLKKAKHFVKAGNYAFKTRNYSIKPVLGSSL